MLALFKKRESAATVLRDLLQESARADKTESVYALAQVLQRDCSGLGLEAAQLRGALDDSAVIAARQTTALQGLESQASQIADSQQRIRDETDQSQAALRKARTSLEHVGSEVGGVVQTLKQVSDAASQITQVALQTRLVAFNASVEAKRAGEAGVGFSVVADAVKDLATQVESISKAIMGTVANLDQRIQSLAQDLRVDVETQATDAADGRQVHLALRGAEAAVHRIVAAAGESAELCQVIQSQVGSMGQEVQTVRDALGDAVGRSERVLGVSERLMEVIATCGMETADTPYIQLAQKVAGDISLTLEQAVAEGRITLAQLFDEQYHSVAGSNPAQHTTAFNAITDARFPALQEPALTALPDVVFCIAADRNGYIATHNNIYCHPQRPGDVAWNTANSRWRRIFNDRTGLASARNTRPFLLQTYRRDMGGGKFVMLKEASAPITVQGRHWGGLRLAYRF